MKNPFLLTLVLLTLITTGCGHTEQPKINVKEVIKSAEVITFDDLSDQQKNQLEYCCSYYPNNWRDGVSFEKEKAYFVKTKIDNNLLADLTESDAFPKKELMDTNNRDLYGKYRNRWGFVDKLGDTIFETEKFEGHRIIDIVRKGNIDEVIVGPLVKKPVKIYIQINDSKNYSDLIPQFTIK